MEEEEASVVIVDVISSSPTSVVITLSADFKLKGFGKAEINMHLKLDLEEMRTTSDDK